MRTRRRFDRAVNQFHSYDYPDAPVLSVIDVPVLGDDESGTLFDPHVIKTCEGGFLAYVSRRSDSSIACYKSSDGVRWKFTSVALSPSDDTSDWDSVVNRACVLRDEKGWFMWYTGQSNGRSAIGLAHSSDGLRFERMSNDPVLLPTLVHEQGSVMNPFVIKDKDQSYRMWYAAGADYEPDVICEARSSDGVNWQKRKEPVLTPGNNKYDQFKVGGCHMLRVSENKLAMFYIGYQNIDVARICLALSENNGISWHRSEHNPLISPKKGTWRAHSVYKPSAILADDGKLRIWFNARSKHLELIGMAIGDGSEVLHYDL